MTHNEKSTQEKKKTPVQILLRLGAGILGLALGAEFVKELLHYN